MPAPILDPIALVAQRQSTRFVSGWPSVRVRVGAPVLMANSVALEKRNLTRPRLKHILTAHQIAGVAEW